MDLNDARKLASDLFKQFDLVGWHFKFDGSVRRFGQCRFRHKTITLSRQLVLLNDEKHVDEIIRHEIAHALLGPGHGHNHKWKQMAINCGAKPERCYDSTIVKPVKHYWIGTCPGCGKQVKRYRKGKVACRSCCDGPFNPEFLFVWRRMEE